MMRTGILTDLEGNEVGTIVEDDTGTIRGEGKGETLVEQAPLKTFDDWLRTIHHSTYLRFREAAES